MIAVRPFSHRVIALIALIALVAVTQAAVACAARPEARTSRETNGSTMRLAAYDDGRAQGRVVARVICEESEREGTTWSDVVALGSGEGAYRLCTATLGSLTCGPGHRRAVRACAEQALGPSPQVSPDSTILRHTMPANHLEVLLEAVEARRPPDEVTGHVLAHRVFAERSSCVALGEAMAKRTREAQERDARLWRDGQLENFEREQREAREQLEALEERNGGAVEGRLAKLEAELGRERRPAERKRIQRQMVDANLAELEAARLRRSIEQTQKLIEAVRSPPPSKPTETFACFAPRGMQPALSAE